MTAGGRLPRVLRSIVVPLVVSLLWLAARPLEGASGPAVPQVVPLWEPVVRQRVIQEGTAVELTIDSRQASGRPAPTLQEGDDIAVRFRITDTTSDLPLAGAYPAAWMHLRSDGEVPGPNTCSNKARTFIGGTLFSRADLDLNVYHVLTLNDDPTITVVDPLFGFGSTKLLALIPLESRGYDWALSERLGRLFVSMPTARQVAIVDTHDWRVTASIAMAHSPGAVAMQPDEHYLWIATGATDDTSGVAVLDTETAKIAAQIPTGRGTHTIAFSGDSRYAFVTNAIDGTLSIIDVGRLKKVRDVRTGETPSAVAFSDLAQMAYVAHEGDGSVVAVEAKSGRIVARMQTRPGVTFIRFAPGGRFGFLVNPTTDDLRILDATSNRIIQGATMLDGPDQVAFSDELAYVRHRDDETVLMISLRDIGVEGRQIQVIDFPGGSSPPGRMSQATPAAGVVQVPGANAVLVSNPGDQSVYFYKEGMAAPMGNFSNYGRTPRAVLVSDRSLRQRSAPGVYETFAQVRQPGLYDVVFFLDSPRTVQCFEVRVEQDPVLQRKREIERPSHVEGVPPKGTVLVGQPARVAFRVTDAATGAPRTGLTDVEIMVMLSPGVWHTRGMASPAGPGGYVFEFIPQAAGAYVASIQIPSERIEFNGGQRVLFRVVDDGSASTIRKP